MAKPTLIPVVIQREEIKELIEDIKRATEAHAEQLERDARLYGKMQTFYGHNRPAIKGDLAISVFRRVEDLIRGV